MNANFGITFFAAVLSRARSQVWVDHMLTTLSSPELNRKALSGLAHSALTPSTLDNTNGLLLVSALHTGTKLIRSLLRHSLLHHCLHKLVSHLLKIRTLWPQAIAIHDLSCPAAINGMFALINVYLLRRTHSCRDQHKGTQLGYEMEGITFTISMGTVTNAVSQRKPLADTLPCFSPPDAAGEHVLLHRSLKIPRAWFHFQRFDGRAARSASAQRAVPRLWYSAAECIRIAYDIWPTHDLTEFPQLLPYIP